jgi:serine phosphatase RsbU (regulator of sigma subunit)/anti-sigma regulatory factor (Ser/Thr protein kinase)
MTSIFMNVGRLIRREQAAPAAPPRPASGLSLAEPVEIAPNDPLIAYFQGSTGPVDIDTLLLDSPGVQALRDAGIKLVVPLVSQGELIGLLNLGPRLSEQDYSADDRRLLENLASHVAPAVQVAQLVRRQEAEARSRERIEQELRIAQIIQQNFLPREAPDLPGWRLDAHYKPAREVGGDFYDFINLSDGRLAIVIGDVTDKGVPAALVMVATRSVLRAAANSASDPGAVLRRANDLLCPDIPANMFATCFYGILDPATGRLHYANAGHTVPYVRTEAGVVELRATGMPLGLLPEMTYEEKEICLKAGDRVLFHSDGLAEAHSAGREMFGFPRLMDLVGKCPADSDMINSALSELSAFTRQAGEQEDDVTLVTLAREAATDRARTPDNGRRLLAEFSVASQPGNERLAIEKVVAAVQGLGLQNSQFERVKTAVGETTMNAMEHGNHYQPDLPVLIRVFSDEAELSIAVSDHGGDRPLLDPGVPDLEAKLAGEQSPRGWGLFLIKNMVDELRTSSDGTLQTVELIFHRKENQDA